MLSTNNSHISAQSSAKQNSAALGRIYGFAIDSISGKPMQYVTVALFQQDDSTVINGCLTDEQGYFNIVQIPQGKYMLKLSYIGFKRLFVDNVIISAQLPTADLGRKALSPAIIETSEITISAEKDALTYNVDKKVINVSALPSVRGGTAVDALRNVPAVNVDIDGNISLRGSANFQALVDGKPSLMSGNDLLRQIPADLIDKIEIITNPSAKYDPDGSSGIINVVMKKQTQIGYNGLLTGSAGTSDKYEINANGNANLEHLNIIASCEFNDRNHFPTSDLIRTIKRDETVETVFSEVNRRMNQKGYRFKIGGDYTFNESQKGSALIDYGRWGFDRYIPARYKSFGKDVGAVFTINKDEFNFGANLLNATLSHKLILSPNKQELNTSLIYANFHGDVPQEVNEFQTDSIYSQHLLDLFRNRIEMKQLRQILRLNSDINHSFADNTKLDFGLLEEIKMSKADYLRNDYDFVNNLWIRNNDLSNNNEYNHLITALYATLSSEFAGFAFKAGLRAEYHSRLYKQKTMGEEYKYEKFSLFPTLHLSKEITKGQQIQLSYSRRVQRPHETQLNPFPDYFDQYIVSRGNPELKPEYTDAYEFNYLFNTSFMMISAETFFRHSYDLISRIIAIKPDGKLWLYPININSNDTYGAGLSANFTFSKSLRLNLAGNFYHNEFSELIDGVNTLRNINSFDGNATLNFVPYIGAFVQLTAYYSGPKNQPNNGRLEGFYFISLALRQEFLERKLSVTLRAQDLFNTSKYVMSAGAAAFSTNSAYFPEKSVFVLAFSYAINDYKRAPKRDEPSEIDFQGGF